MNDTKHLPNSRPTKKNRLQTLRALSPVLLMFLMGCAALKYPGVEEVRWQSYWDGLVPPGSPLDAKVILPPPALIKHLRRFNHNQGRELPDSDGVSADDLTIVRSAIADLPPDIQYLFDRYTSAIIVVNHLGSSGYSWATYLEDNYAKKGFIVVDKKILRTGSNLWFSRREGSPFSCEPPWRIEVDVGNEASPGLVALQYILIHDLAHNLSEGTTINPSYDSEPNDKGIRGSDYGRFSWSVLDNKYRSAFDQYRQDRDSLKYYPLQTPKFDCADAIFYYTDLERVDFPALYAVQTPFEDFAESFANFIHVLVLGRKFEIRIFNGELPTKEYYSCWKEPRCMAKRAYLQFLYDYLRKRPKA